jgi:hypothetical protein
MGHVIIVGRCGPRRCLMRKATKPKSGGLQETFLSFAPVMALAEPDDKLKALTVPRGHIFCIPDWCDRASSWRYDMARKK